MVVREYMSSAPVTLESHASIDDACKLMGEKHIGSILICRGQAVQAIFTERDLISKVIPRKENLASAKVETYASSPLITVSSTADVKEAARIMTEMKVRRLVVVEDGRPIGIFTAADLARAVGRHPLEL